MYQTLVSSATSVSRIAGPVCITRLAMRPAKSFWKNAQDWRTTYQWFCHLMRLDTFAEIAWFARRESPEVQQSNFRGLWAGRGWPPERG
jgi:hypothetical protein